MTKPGRNDLCHCGSGKKYKKCHELKEGNGGVRSKVLMIVVGGGILAAIVVAIAQFTGAGTGTGSGTRTWDPAHGHFHDANGVQVP